MENDRDQDMSRYDRVIAVITDGIFIGTTMIYLYTAFHGPFSDMVQRSLLLMLCGVAMFLKKGLKIGGKANGFTRSVDVLFAAGFAITGIYIICVWRNRILMSSAVPMADIVMGTIFIALLLIVTRRCIGSFVVVFCLFLIGYTVFGRYFPSFMAHRGQSWKHMIKFLYITTEGVFGTTAGTAASYIILFVAFGAFMEVLGAGAWFVDVAYALTGRYRGGPAKAAVASSALLGMISGSPAANVATTGTFTIPLMKKIGYNPEEAGAIEAVASTGGLFTPPVMGAAAFILAENIGMTYRTVALGAVVPALLYYLSLILVIDGIAVKRHLLGVSGAELPSIGKAMRERGLFALPIFGLIGVIVAGWSITKAAFYAVLAVVIVAYVQKSTRTSPKMILKALKQSTASAASIIITCGCAGIIVGTIELTGLGAKLSYSLIGLANGNVYIGALAVMVVTLILGCAMPPTTTYIIAATILARPLIEMGVIPLCAHMFIFMFSCVGAITPPVALAAYTAAGISGGNANKTGFRAFRYGICAFLVPFFFLLNPELLVQGEIAAILSAIVSAAAAVICLVTAFEGYFFRYWGKMARVILAGAAFFLFIPGTRTDFMGIGGILLAAALDICMNRSNSSRAI